MVTHGVKSRQGTSLQVNRFPSSNPALARPIAAFGHMRKAAGKVPVFWNLLFLLLLAGPPKFRIRDSMDSLNGILDTSLLILIGVYVAAGVLLIFSAKHLKAAVRYGPQKIAILFIASIGLSALVSRAPFLTMFKTYQMAVLFLFTAVFIERFGVERTISRMLWGTVILSGLVILGIYIIPEGVLFYSETGFPRLRGTAVADVGTMAPILVALVTCSRVKFRRLLLPGSLVLAFFSLARVAWVAIFVLFLIAFLRRANIWSRKWITVFCFLGILTPIISEVPSLIRNYRDPDLSVYTDLSGRPLIWQYTTRAVWDRDPLRGLGYGVASRVLTGNLDPRLGNAHSIYVDVFLGAGLIGLISFVTLMLALAGYCWYILKHTRAEVPFTVVSLFLVVFVMIPVAGDLDGPPLAFTLWSLFTLAPHIRSQIHAELRNRAVQRMGSMSSVPTVQVNRLFPVRNSRLI